MRKMKGGMLAISLFVSLVITIVPVSAADIHVPGDYATISTAITNANSGDTIYVHAGTYTENLTIGKDLSLIGDGASVTTIDGSGLDVITVNGAVVNISGFTVRNGGYGIYYQNNASGTITNNTITNSLFDIYNSSSSPTVTINTITGSHTGIINISGSNPTITNNTITGNTSRGIYNTSGSNPTIMNNTITGNSLYGIQNSSSSPTITNNTITGQSAGIYNSSSNPTITNNTITGNSYEGIANTSGSNPTITNNTITGNSLYGIHNSSSSPTITNNTITGHMEGIYNISSSPTITNNTITGNSYGIYNVSSSNPPITNNIVVSNGVNGIYDDGSGAPVCTYNDAWNNGTDYVNVTPGIGSISQDPQLDGTYHLTASSPCIDAGTDAGVYTDMDGDSRPQGSGFDIGADEYYISQVFVNPIPAFMIIANYHLRQVNTCLGCITDNLPEDVPGDVQALLDEMQEHINNANTTGNPIYANNELLKALKCCEDIQEILGITCPI